MTSKFKRVLGGLVKWLQKVRFTWILTNGASRSMSNVVKRVLGEDWSSRYRRFGSLGY